MIKIKVCGMRDPGNIKKISDIQPDFMGFIFFKGSKRYIGDTIAESFFDNVSGNIQKVGVFVNEINEKVINTAFKYNMKVVQLHGNESPDYCDILRNTGIKVIKAFGVNDEYDFKILKAYLQSCDFFLFDTKTEHYGGSGQKFNWDKISEYNYDIPFFLSGGIGINDTDAFLKINHPALYAVDVNSKFEIEPALKDPELLKKFIYKIRTY